MTGLFGAFELASSSISPTRHRRSSDVPAIRDARVDDGRVNVSASHRHASESVLVRYNDDLGSTGWQLEAPSPVEAGEAAVELGSSEPPAQRLRSTAAQG